MHLIHLKKLFLLPNIEKYWPSHSTMVKSLRSMRVLVNS